MTKAYRSLPVFILFFTLTIAGCDDEDRIAGKIKTVYTYDNENVLRRKESYEYDDEGKLVKERIVIDDKPEYSREFKYEGDRLVRMTDRNLIVTFTYDTQGQLDRISTPTIELGLQLEKGRLALAGGYFIFNYDERENLTSITHADQTLQYMAKGSYEYDEEKYIYTSFPVPLRHYFALFRSESNTLTSDIFRFNPGPNNITRNDRYKRSGEAELYHLFKYKYHEQGFPTELDLETYSFDANGNSRLDFTYHYIFEYY